MHHEGVFLRNAAAVDNLLDLDAIFFKAINDRERAEGGRLDERAVDFRRGAVQRLTDQQPAEKRVDKNRAITIVPIERDEAAFTRPVSDVCGCKQNGLLSTREVVTPGI